MGLKEDLRGKVMSLFKQEVHFAVISVIEAIWKEDKRPQLHRKKKTSLGWEFTFTLPPGMSFRDFKNKEEYFRDALGDVTTEVIHVDKFAVLKIVMKKLDEWYEYDWQHKPDTNMILPIPIGYTHEKLLEVDLAKIYNILIGGYIGGGKTTAVQVMVNSLLHLNRPPKIVLIDFKRLDFAYLKNHVLLATNNDMAFQSLARLECEMFNRINQLENMKCVGIEGYNKKTNNSMDYIVLVIDELAQLDNQKAQKILASILQMGRAPGIHTILATQRPDATIFGGNKFSACKAMLVGRLCFQVADAVNSRIILDSTEGADIPNVAGRAIWKVRKKAVEVQVPFLNPEIAEVKLLEQPSEMYEQRCFDSTDDIRVGSNGHGAIKNTVISLLSSGAAQIAKITGAKED